MNRIEAARTRRAFLRRSLELVLAAPLLAPVLGGFAMAAGRAGTARGGRISVRDKGARGDGHTDDTDAIQAAIDALPDAGGTVTVPPGNYRIDATRALNLRSNMRLEMAPTAQLTALPNGLKRYHVIKVWHADNVEIAGGRIVGERDEHQGTEGEWGYGLNIQASRNVRVTGTHISDCWGDGIWIGAFGHGPDLDVATDVTLDGVVSTNNRRQGLSIGPVERVTVVNCTFSNTNGTAPQAGIDLEPQKQGPARDVLIRDCLITGNKGSGIEVHHNVFGLVIRGCTITGNHGYGVLSVDGSDLWIDANTITGNGLVGVTMAKHTSDVRITGNTLSANSARQLHRAFKALTRPEHGAHAGQLRVDDSTSNVQVSGNTFSS